MSSSGRPRSTSSRAQLDGAQWNLDKTIVRAPADGYVTNVALRKGARVANLPLSPVMAFIDTSETMHRGRDPADRCPLRRSRPAGRDDVQVHSRARSTPARSKPCCRRCRAARRGFGHSGGAEGELRRRRSSSASSSTTQEFAKPPARRRDRHRGDLHRARQAGAHHPQGDAAADRDRELRQSVLSYFRCVTTSGAWARVVSPGVRARTASGPASP